MRVDEILVRITTFSGDQLVVWWMQRGCDQEKGKANTVAVVLLSYQRRGFAREARRSSQARRRFRPGRDKIVSGAGRMRTFAELSGRTEEKKWCGKATREARAGSGLARWWRRFTA
jgi:hypothetical protein